MTSDDLRPVLDDDLEFDVQQLSRACCCEVELIVTL